MTERLKGKVALVTGASSGLGRASALMFAREGAKVIVADVAIAGGEETVRMIRGAGGEAIFVKTDVAKAAEVESLINRSIETYGRLDCAHNNAGVVSPEPLTSDHTEEQWDQIINVNLKGVWLCMKYEIPQMLKQGGGAIVNTSSVAGFFGGPYSVAYTASKHGVNGVTKVAASEYARAGIRINAVCPGGMRTPPVERDLKEHPEMVATRRESPIGRISEPEEVAEAVVWLCTDAASFVTGLCMAVDGGLTAQ